MPRDNENALVYEETLFTALREEGADLFAAHWREAATDLSVPLDVMWEEYRLMEERRLLVTIAARRAGALRGYVVYRIGRSPHYRGLVCADQDVIYLDPMERLGWAATRMIRRAETALAARGVTCVTARVKLHVTGGRSGHDHVAVYEGLGYRPEEILCRKRIG